MKVMGEGLPGGTSFMEDYTYHLAPGGHQVLGAHMLEICPTIADGQADARDSSRSSIGGKEDPVRLVFDAPPGPALNASLIDLGARFRLLVNEVTAVDHPALPKLPVARAVWECKPDFKTACAAWILAGGAHHTGFSYSVTRRDARGFRDHRRHRDRRDRRGNDALRRSSRTSATTTSIIISRRGSAPDARPRTDGHVQGTQARSL